MRLLAVLFFLLFVVAVCPLSASAELPEISAAVETQLYQGTTEEVTAFIGKRQAQVDDLIALIKVDVRMAKVESDKIALSSVLDLFQGLSLQLKNLLAELARPEIPALPLPSLSSPPYSISIFDEMVAFQRKAEKQLAACKEALAAGEARMTALKDELPLLLSRYVKDKADETSRVQSYERLAHLFSLQYEYALLQLKKPKLEKELANTQNGVKEAAVLVDKVFGQLQISRDDLAAVEKKVDLFKEELAKSLVRLNAESLELDKQGVVTESKLDRVVTAMTQEVKEGVNAIILEGEKKRLDLVLDAIRIRQRAIVQEKMNLGLSKQGLTFRQEWLAACVEVAKGEKSADFVATWRKNNEELTVKKDDLVRELAQATQQRADLTQRLVTLTKEVETAGNADLKRAIAGQTEKTTRNLDVLILDIADNVHDLNQLQEEIGLIVRLLVSRMDASERFFSLALAYVTEKWEQVSLVLTYPLFTMGGISFTLISLIKVIILVLIGVWVLKVVRRKTARILTAKTAMAPGTVNSLTTLVYYAALVLGVLVILSTIGFNVSQLGVVFGALGVGIGFGLQTVFNNFISGIILLTEQTIQAGDYVQLQTGVDGEVKKISIRATIVRTFDGEDVIVPNSELVSSRVNTWSYGDNWRRLKIPFGVSYDADPDEVVRLATEAAREIETTKEDANHPLRVFFEGFGNNSLDFSIRPWCWMKRGHVGMLSDYYFVLFRKLKAAGIEIPFPQTELHLKSIAPEVLAVLKKNAVLSGQDGFTDVAGKGGGRDIGG